MIDSGFLFRLAVILNGRIILAPTIADFQFVFTLRKNCSSCPNKSNSYAVCLTKPNLWRPLDLLVNTCGILFLHVRNLQDQTVQRNTACCNKACRCAEKKQTEQCLTEIIFRAGNLSVVTELILLSHDVAIGIGSHALAGEGGYTTKFYTWSLRPAVRPLIPFKRKGTPPSGRQSPHWQF